MNSVAQSKWYLFLLLTLGSWGSMLAQPVQAIHFDGISKHKPQYLLRLIQTEVGQVADSAAIAEDAQELRNQFGIQAADYRLDTTAEGIELTFLLQEKFTLLPIFGFGGVKGNIWFQFGVADINFLGRGHQFTVSYLNMDGRSNYNAYYRVPRFGDSKWGASAGFSRRASVEPLYFENDTVFYDYDFISFGATGIRNLGRNHYLEFGGNYFIENYLKNERHDNTVTPGPEGLQTPKMLAKVIHYLNRRNYHFFYLSGFDNRLSLQVVYDTGDQSWFQMLINDTRYFARIRKRGNLAVRTRLGLATNRDSPFAPFVLDSYVNIRGVGNRVDRGTAAALLNLEYRHTLLDKAAIALQGVVFSDMGSWRKPGGELNDFVDSKNFRHFAGLGFRAIYKRVYNATLRVDYGIDLYDPNQRGFVVGIGQYF